MSGPRAVGAAALTVATLLPACGGHGPTPTPPPSPPTPVRLTFDGHPKGQPAIAPDGRRIAYVADRGDGWQVRVLDPATGDDRAVTAVQGPVGGPVWAPDGTLIHFYGAADDTWRRFAVAADSPGAEPALRALHDGGLRAVFRPRPEPDDGPRLLLDGVMEPGEDHDLFLLGPGPGDLRRLAPHPGYDSDGRWSPDGRSVVFHSDRDRDRLRLRVYRVEVDGGDVRPLTPDDDAVYAYPAWSPSGLCVAHTVESDGDRDLAVVGADGTGGVRVAPRPGFDGDPVFTADGTALVAVTDRWGPLELMRVPLPTELRSRCRGSSPRDLHTAGAP